LHVNELIIAVCTAPKESKLAVNLKLHDRVHVGINFSNAGSEMSQEIDGGSLNTLHMFTGSA
jgi:hypothetical protein